MQVHYGEGVAIRTGPEPCVGIREGVGEASAGERTGQPSSRESARVPGADAVSEAEGHMSGRVSASVRTTRRGRRPWHVRTLLVREPRDLTVDQDGMPPTLVATAGLDPLRDDGRAYAAKLIAGGVPTIYREFPGTIHGFCTFRKGIPSAQDDLAIILRLAKVMVEEATPQ